MVSLFGTGSFISQLSGGELTDRFGRRPVMLMSFFITPIFMIALGLARDLGLISISTFIVGFFTDLIDGGRRGNCRSGATRIADAGLWIQLLGDQFGRRGCAGPCRTDRRVQLPDPLRR